MLVQLFFTLFGFFLFGVLHALFELFFFCCVADRIQHFYDPDIRVGSLFQRIAHPPVGFTADVNEKVSVGDREDIVHGGLIAVHVNAAVVQQDQFRIARILPEDVFCPVICREDCSGDPEPVPLFRGFIRPGFASRQAEHQQEHEECENSIFFHLQLSISVSIFIPAGFA